MINLNLEGVIFCCLLGCLFESFLFNQQKSLRLCAFFVFSQRTINDMQSLRGNKVTFFILVLYPLLRFTIENIFNVSLIFQHLTLLIANSLFSVVKCTNKERTQQKNNIQIVQNGIKKNNYSLNSQTNQSNLTYCNGQDIYGIQSDPQQVNQTKHEQSSIIQIYNNIKQNNISMLNDEDLPHFNSFHTSKIKQTQDVKNVNFLSGRDISSDKSNFQNLTFQNMQIKQDSDIYEQSQKKYIMDWIQSQISTGVILLDKNKKLVFSNKPLKKIINKNRIFANIQELTYFFSLRLQMIQKYKKQFHTLEKNINCTGSQNPSQNNNQEKLANTKFDQFLQEQQQRENDKNKSLKNKQKQDQNGLVIYNQQQSNKNIQFINQQLSPSSKEYLKMATVELLSNNSQTDTIFQSRNLVYSQSQNPKIQFSPQKVQSLKLSKKQVSSKALISHQDKMTSTFLNTTLLQNQLKYQKLVQCILPNNVNKLFTKENLQIDDIINFLIKYSYSPSYQKMNTDNRIQTEQSDDNTSYKSYKIQKNIGTIGKKVSVEIKQNIDDSEILDKHMQNHIKNDINSSNKSSKHKQNTTQNTNKQEEEQIVFDGLTENNIRQKQKKVVKKKLYDYFVKNNYLHVTVELDDNDLTFEDISIFGIKLSVFQQSDEEENKLILIEVQDITKLKKQIDNENLDNYKNKILSSVSHELRTPLNCSIQMLEMLSQNEEISNILKQIFIFPALNSNLLLLNIINDILDLAQINYGKFTMLFYQLELNQICIECINLISMQALQKKIEIELDLDPCVPQKIHSDPNRIRQVLLNLLSNALKFTQQGKIIIKTKLIEESLIMIDVEDTGCGISEKNLKIIQNRFNSKDVFSFLYNQRNNKSNTVDVGLGLTIANNLATGLGGNRKLHVSSVENKGTKFSFWIVNHSTNKIGCEFIKKNIFSQEIIKWQSISDYSQVQQQQYLHIQLDSNQQNSNHPNTNSGNQQSNMSIRSKQKNEDSSYYQQNNKYNNQVQSLIKFNNEVNQSHIQSMSYPINQTINLPKEQNSNFSNNMSLAEGTKNKKFQLSFREQSLLSDDQGSIFDSNLLPQNQVIIKGRNMDFNNSKVQILENLSYHRSDSQISVKQRNETSSLDNHHELDKQQYIIHQKQIQQHSPLKYNKLNKSSDLNTNNVLGKNMQNNIGQLYQNNSKSPKKIQSKAISPHIVPQQSIFSTLNNQNENKHIFNKCTSIISQNPFTNQSNSELINQQSKNLLKYSAYENKQQFEILLSTNDQSEECDITHANETQQKQIPNYLSWSKVSEKRTQTKSLNKQTSNNSQESSILKSEVGVKIKFKDNTMNEMYQNEVAQNQFLHNEVNFCSDSFTQIHDSAIEWGSTFNKTYEEIKQNDQINLNNIKKIDLSQTQSGLKNKDLNEDQIDKKQNQTSISLNQQPEKSKNEQTNHKIPQKIDIIDIKINSQLQTPQSQSPISAVKQKIQNYNSQRQCQCPNILIVDDNDFNIYALETRLKSYGFIIDRATSGFIALENVQKRLEGEQSCCKLYTLIFMDIEMPQKDGFETTKDILSYYSDKKISKPPPISACTAYIQQSEQDKAKQCGMLYYITKPINQLKLEEILVSVIFNPKIQK